MSEPISSETTRGPDAGEGRGGMGWLPGRLLRLGWAGGFCLVVGMGLLGLLGARLGWGRGEAMGGWWILGVSWLLWAVAVAAAAELPLAGFWVAGLWLGWHGLSLMAPWAGTLLVGLPVGWLLLVGLALLVKRGPQGRGASSGIWAVLAMGAGFLAGEPTGWNGWLGCQGGRAWAGQVALGVVLAVVGELLRPMLKDRPWAVPGFARVLGGSVGVAAVGVAVVAWRDFPAAVGWAGESLRALGSWAAWAWFLLAGGFCLRLVEGAEWGSRELVRGLRWRRARWILPRLWLGVTLGEWATTHWSGRSAALTGWVGRWPFDLKIVVWSHAWVGVVVLVLAAGVLGQGRWLARWWPRLNAAWVAALLGMVAAAGALSGRVEANDAAQSAHGWPVLVLFLGVGCFGSLLWEQGAAAARVAGAVVFCGALLGVEWTAPSGWVGRSGPAVLLGLLHVGLPMVLHRWGCRKTGAGQSLSGSAYGWLTLAGMACALGVLQWDTSKAALLAVCPVLWVGVLAWLRMRQPGLDLASGMLAGGLLGSATVAAWCRPGLLLPEVPLVSWLNVPAAAMTGDRPFLDPVHFILLLMLGTVGALLGAVFFRSGGGPGLPLILLLSDPEPESPQAASSGGGLWTKQGSEME